MYVNWLALSAIVAGFAVATAVAAPDYPDQSASASRARYINASGGLDRAWGEWTLLVRYLDGKRPQVVIGIDTENRCRMTACAFGYEKACKPIAAKLGGSSVSGWSDTTIKYAICYEAGEV